MSNPLKSITELADDYVKRRKTINNVRWLIVFLNLILAVVVIWITWCRLRDDSIKSDIKASLIDLAAIFYGTAAIGLISTAFESKEKIEDAKSLKEKMNTIAKNPESSDYPRFFSMLEKLLQKFYE
jgi:glucan phosphoethanolaminetransferase (alkaline phosphatase superfamily)